MIGIYTMALTIGAALASGLSAQLLTAMNSWRNTLGIWSVFALIAVIVWIPVLRRSERSEVVAAMGNNAGMPWRNAKAWLLTLSFGLMAMLFYTVTAWLPPIVQSMGYSKVDAANVLTLFAVVQIPAGLILRTLLTKFPSRLLWLISASILELIGFALLLFAAPPWIPGIMIGFGAGTLFSLNLMLPIDMTRDAQEAAFWAAMTQSVGYVIGETGPILLGWIYDATNRFSLAIVVMIAINALMIVVQAIAVSKKSPETVKAERSLSRPS